MTKIWAGPAVGWAYLVCVIDCCTRRSWDGISRTAADEDALAAVEQAVLERLPRGSREENVTLTTDNGTQFLPRGSWRRSHGSASRIEGRRIITGRQQLHRTVPPQLERGGSLDGGVSDLGEAVPALLVGSRSTITTASSRSRRSTPHEAFLLSQLY